MFYINVIFENSVTFINDSLIADHHVPLAVVYVNTLTVFLQNWSSELELFR